MSKYGYLEVFQRVPSTSRYRESTVFLSDYHSDSQVINLASRRVVMSRVTIVQAITYSITLCQSLIPIGRFITAGKRLLTIKASFS